MSRLTILMYHMIAAPQSRSEARYACPPARFRQHMRFLRTRGYQPVALRDFDRYASGAAPIPHKAVAVTFDDGFRDNYEQALPILQEYAIPATLFMVSGLAGQQNRWMNGVGYPARAMLSWTQVREMSEAGVEIGGHTVNHARLPELPVERVRSEILDCKRMIEDRIGREVGSFAYPYGLFSDAAQEAVAAAGYLRACSTRSGFNRPTTDKFLLRRIEVQGSDSVRKLRQKMEFGTNEAGLMVPLRYYWRRFRARARHR